jgi:hypothetical protein
MARFLRNIAALEATSRRFERGGDVAMARLYRDDAEGLRGIAVAVKVKDYRRARRLARKMDTVAVDEIPTAIYEEIFRGFFA